MQFLLHNSWFELPAEPPDYKVWQISKERLNGRDNDTALWLSPSPNMNSSPSLAPYFFPAVPTQQVKVAKTLQLWLPAIFFPLHSLQYSPPFSTLQSHVWSSISFLIFSAQSPPHSLPSQGRKNIQYLKFARIANGGHWIVNVIVRVVVRNCQNICSLKFTFSFYVHFQKRQKIFTYWSSRGWNPQESWL